MLILFLLAFGIQTVFGQYSELPYYTIKGKVKDQDNNKIIVFATVSIVGTHVGTVTNPDGEFTIKIKKSFNAKELEFSHIGYNNKKVLISGLKPEGNKISLESSSVSLDEVTIRPSNAAELVRNALSLVPKNYSVIPLNYTGFYRETIKQRLEKYNRRVKKQNN